MCCYLAFWYLSWCWAVYTNPFSASADCLCEPSWSIATTAGTAEISSASATTDHFGSHTLTFHGLSDNRLKTGKYFWSISLTMERRVCVHVFCNSY